MTAGKYDHLVERLDLRRTASSLYSAVPLGQQVSRQDPEGDREMPAPPSDGLHPEHAPVPSVTQHFKPTSTRDMEERMNRGIIGAIIGVLVIIILVLVILRLT